jgi:heat shock protein HspQ
MLEDAGGALFNGDPSKAMVMLEARGCDRPPAPYVHFPVRIGMLYSMRMNARLAKFALGQVVHHRVYAFRGVIFDVDPVFANTEEYWLSIPESIRPHKDQPFYHLLAENDQGSYVAYVSEQNLLPDDSGEPVGHPQTTLIFDSFQNGQYHLRPRVTH